MIDLFNKDSLEIANIDSKSIDLILEDMPYGNTNNAFDYKVNLELYWPERLRIIKDNGAIILTAQQPFTTYLINSCRKYFRYELIWEKTQKIGYANAKKMPLRGHENILIFYKKLPTYNPQKIYSANLKGRRSYKKGIEYQGYSGGFRKDYVYNNTDGMGYPHSIVKFSNRSFFGENRNDIFHPTQKPIPLFEWLIKTYSNEGDLVFDGFIGSGTTAVACHKNNRNCLGFEIDKEYFEAALKRLKNHQAQLQIFNSHA